MPYKTFLITLFKNNPALAIEEIDDARKVYNQENGKTKTPSQTKQLLNKLIKEDVIEPVTNEDDFLIGYNSLIY